MKFFPLFSFIFLTCHSSLVSGVFKPYKVHLVNESALSLDYTKRIHYGAMPHEKSFLVYRGRGRHLRAYESEGKFKSISFHPKKNKLLTLEAKSTIKEWVPAN